MVYTIKKLKEVCIKMKSCEDCPGDELCNFMNDAPENIEIETLDKAHKEFLMRLG